MALRNLLVSIRATASEWQSDMRRIEGEAKQLEKSLKPTMDLAKNLGLSFAAAGAAITGALGVMVKSAVDAGDALRDLSIRTGASVEQLSVLKFAAEQSGASIEDIGAGMRVLAKNATEAAAGSKEQAQAFRALGISVKDAQGNIRPVNDLLLDVADRFAATRDGAEKSAAAMALFGKGGMALIPVLNEGSAGIRAMGDDLEDLGGIMSTEFANAADQFNDEMTRAKKAVDGLFVSVASALVPALTEFLNKITPLIAEVGKFAKENELLTKALGGVGLALTGTGGVLAGLSGVLLILPKLNSGLNLLRAHPALTGIALGGSIIAGIIAFRTELQSLALTAQSAMAGGLGKLLALLADLAGGRGFTGAANFLGGLSEDLAQVSRNFSATALLVNPPAFTGPTIDPEELARRADNRPVLKLTDSLKKMVPVVGELDGLLKRDIFDPIHRMFDPSQMAEDAADVRQLIKETNQERLKAEQETNEAIQKELSETTRYRVAEILKARAEDDRNWKEQMQIDRERAEKMFDSIKRTASDTFLAMFKDGEFRFKALADSIKGIFLTLINEIMSTLTARLLQPLVGKITGLILGGTGGGGIGGSIAGGASSGLIGKLGGALAAKLGIGSAGAAAAAASVGAAPGAIGVINPATGALVTGSSGGIVGTLGALATNPITWGVAGAIGLGLAWRAFQAHPDANRLVQKIQNPFGEALKSQVDAFNASMAAGKLTEQQARESKAAVEQLWMTFQTQAAEFAKGGSDEALVVRQAFEQLGPLMHQIFSDMDRDIQKLVKTEEELGQAIDANAPRRALSGWNLPETGIITAALAHLRALATSTTAPPYSPIVNVDVTGEMSPDEVLRIVNTALETGQRGYLERWSTMIRNAQPGLISTVPAV